MPNRIRNGRYGRTNGRPGPLPSPRVRSTAARSPRLRGACAYGEGTADELTSSLLGNLIPSGLSRVCQAVPEWLQQRAQRLAGHQLRDDGVGPDGLIGVRDEVPSLPDERRGSLERRRRVGGEEGVLGQGRQPAVGKRRVSRVAGPLVVE